MGNKSPTGIAPVQQNSQTTSWGTMKGNTADNHEIAKWDPAFTKQIANAVGPAIKRWYRADHE